MDSANTSVPLKGPELHYSRGCGKLREPSPCLRDCSKGTVTICAILTCWLALGLTLVLKYYHACFSMLRVRELAKARQQPIAPNKGFHDDFFLGLTTVQWRWCTWTATATAVPIVTTLLIHFSRLLMYQNRYKISPDKVAFFFFNYDTTNQPIFIFQDAPIELINRPVEKSTVPF